MNFFLYLLISFSVFISGCSAKFYSSLEPIEPKLSYLGKPTEIQTLTPIFEWTKADEPGVKYDFGIFLPSYGKWIPGGNTTNYGNPIYYVEALNDNKHTVEIALKPGTIYAWSVRTRVGDKVNHWSNYDRYTNMGLVAGSVRNHFFEFRTPD